MTRIILNYYFNFFLSWTILSCVMTVMHCFQIFYTDEGVLSIELGVYVAEAVMDKNVRGARGRFKMYGDNEVVFCQFFVLFLLIVN